MRRALAFGMYGLTLVALVVAVAIFAQGASRSLDSVESLALAPIPFVFGSVGLLLVWRVPDNRIGWVFLTGATLFGLWVVTHIYYFTGVVVEWPVVWLVALLSYILYMPAILSLTALPLLLFPTGHTPSNRWRWVLGILVLFVGLNTVGHVLSPQMPSQKLGQRSADEIAVEYLAVEDGETVVQVDNPLAVQGVTEWQDVLAPAFLVLLAVAFLAPAASMVQRLTTARGEERLQIKWLGLAALIAGLGLGTFYLIQELVPDAPILGLLSGIGLIGLLGIPVAAGVAITRYRLYEIDRLISRTITYTVVVGLLGLLFAAGVVWLPTTLGLGDSPFLVAATTLLVAALFNPLRTRVQMTVDRRFNRSKFLSEQVAQRFATRLHTADDLDEILELWIATVSRSLEPETAGIWLADDRSRLHEQPSSRQPR